MPTTTGPAITYTATPSGGSGPFEYQWSISPNTGYSITNGVTEGVYQGSSSIVVDWNAEATYTVSVSIREQNNTSCLQSNSRSVVVSDSGGCNDFAPTNLSVSTNFNTLANLTWTDNSGNETGYQVEISTDGSNWSIFSTLGANTTSLQTNTGLSNNTTYFFRVRALGICNTDYTNTASVLTAPDEIQGLSTNATGSIYELNITWSDSNPNLGINPLTYEVEAAHSSGSCISSSFRSITTTGSLSHLINNLKANSPGNGESVNFYGVRVRAKNTNGVVSNWVTLLNQSPTLAIGGFIDNDPGTCAYWTN